MSIPPSSPAIAALLRLARSAGASVAVVGLLVAAGWAFDVPSLKSVLPHLVTMKVNTAMGFILAGTALWLLVPETVAPRRRWAAWACAAAASLVGLLTLAEHVLGRDFGIDQILFRDDPAAINTSHPGRMAPATALSFAMIGAALLGLDGSTRRGFRPTQALAALTAGLAMLALLGYAYGVPSLYSFVPFTPMAVHTAVALFVLSAGVLFARPDRGILRTVVAGGKGGTAARRLLPAALVVPAVLGWLWLVGERKGLYSTGIGLSLVVVSATAVFMALIWNNARLLEREEIERMQTAEVRAEQARLVAFNEDVNVALTEASAPRQALQRCAEAMVKHLGAAFARVWTLDDMEKVLLLQASAGMYTHLNGSHGKVPVGRFKIGLIAEERQPHLTNEVLSDQRLSDPEWARREGMVAFAGYPLVVDDRLVGVMAMFSRTRLTNATLDSMSAVAKAIALGVERRRSEEALRWSEEQLRQAQKMEAIGRLAGGVAHDFNNQLTVILGYADRLLRPDALSGLARQGVEEIRKAGVRAASLTSQLLAFSRKQILELKVIDLNSVAEEMEKLLRRVIGADIELKTATAKAPALARADRGQIEQVILNLALNARDAMPRGGKLTLEVSARDLDEAYCRRYLDLKPGRYVLLEVSDTGIGMDKVTLSRVFEPFFTTKAPGKGTGLGLATVHGIVKQTGGHLRTYSEPGLGTTFKIYLPREEASAAWTETRESPASPARGSETVLLVEDEAQVREMARTILLEHGYKVLEAKNGSDALQLCSSHEGPIHLAVTDVVLPGMGGRDFVQHLAAVRPEAKVLYTSGYSEAAVASHGIVSVDGMFLPKPYTPNELLLKARQLLDNTCPGGADGGKFT